MPKIPVYQSQADVTPAINTYQAKAPNLDGLVNTFDSISEKSFKGLKKHEEVKAEAQAKIKAADDDHQFAQAQVKFLELQNQQNDNYAKTVTVDNVQNLLDNNDKDFETIKTQALQAAGVKDPQLNTKLSDYFDLHYKTQTQQQRMKLASSLRGDRAQKDANDYTNSLYSSLRSEVDPWDQNALVTYQKAVALTGGYLRSTGKRLNLDDNTVNGMIDEQIKNLAKATILRRIEANPERAMQELYGKMDEYKRDRDLQKVDLVNNASKKGTKFIADIKSKMNPDEYNTQLSPEDEVKYQTWFTDMQQKGFIHPKDSGQDYDFRGAWQAGISPDKPGSHWTDTFKKPNHQTFSNESKYAKDHPELAGKWKGDKYIAPDVAAVFDKQTTQETSPENFANSKYGPIWSAVLSRTELEDLAERAQSKKKENDAAAEKAAREKAQADAIQLDQEAKNNLLGIESTGASSNIKQMVSFNQPFHPISQEDQIMVKYAKQYKIDPYLIKAVMGQESGGAHFSKNGRVKKSPAGATGAMQLMPLTAKGLGVDPNNMEQNIEGGVRMLSNLVIHYKGDLTKALAAYNAGQGAVDKYKGVPPYNETQNYVKAIMGKYTHLVNASGVQFNDTLHARLYKNALDQGNTPEQAAAIVKQYNQKENIAKAKYSVNTMLASSLTPQELSSSLTSLKKRADNTPNNDWNKEALYAAYDVMGKEVKSRMDLIKKDPVKYLETYSNNVKVATGPDKARLVIAYQQKMGVPNYNIRVASNEEATAIIDSIKKETDVAKQFSRLQQYKQVYGGYFPNLVKQLEGKGLDSTITSVYHATVGGPMLADDFMKAHKQLTEKVNNQTILSTNLLAKDIKGKEIDSAVLAKAKPYYNMLHKVNPQSANQALADMQMMAKYYAGNSFRNQDQAVDYAVKVWALNRYDFSDKKGYGVPLVDKDGRATNYNTKQVKNFLESFTPPSSHVSIPRLSENKVENKIMQDAFKVKMTNPNNIDYIMTPDEKGVFVRVFNPDTGRYTELIDKRTNKRYTIPFDYAQSKKAQDDRMVQMGGKPQNFDSVLDSMGN